LNGGTEKARSCRPGELVGEGFLEKKGGGNWAEKDFAPPVEPWCLGQEKSPGMVGKGGGVRAKKRNRRSSKVLPSPIQGIPEKKKGQVARDRERKTNNNRGRCRSGGAKPRTQKEGPTSLSVAEEKERIIKKKTIRDIFTKPVRPKETGDAASCKRPKGGVRGRVQPAGEVAKRV